jgi:tight adherence protein C
MNPLLIVGALAVMAAVPILVWTFVLGEDKRKVSAADLLGPGVSASLDLRGAQLQRPAWERALPLLKKMKKVTPAGWADKTEQRIQMAGLAGSWSMEKVLLVKVVGTVIGGLLSFFFYGKHPKFSPTDVNFIGMILCGPLGFFGMDMQLKNKADKRALEITQTLPDILDQITIGVEAGLGFDSAMSRSAKSNEGALADELVRTLQHVQAGLSRAEALRGLAQRNKVPELRQFVSAILQAEQFGIPMAQVLRVQAAEQRRKRRQRAEEKAMKLPVKVLFPLVLCILPALFVVLIGPAGIRIATGL